MSPEDKTASVHCTGSSEKTESADPGRLHQRCGYCHRRKNTGGIFDNGKADGFDTHENLLKGNEIYREIYEAQTQGGGDFDTPGADGNNSTERKDGVR